VKVRRNILSKLLSSFREIKQGLYFLQKRSYINFFWRKSLIRNWKANIYVRTSYGTFCIQDVIMIMKFLVKIYKT